MNNSPAPVVARDLAESYRRVRVENIRASAATLGPLRATQEAEDGSYLRWLSKVGVKHREVNTDLGLRIHLCRSIYSVGALPLIVFLHAGGMVSGRWHTGLRPVLPAVARGEAMVASVEYRLAPEDPYPAQLLDAAAAVNFLDTHRDAYGAAEGPMILAGFSAGGGLAAALSILLRDTASVRFSHQLLMSPMLDHRFSTPSSTMLVDDGVWDFRESRYAWESYLADHRPSPDSYCSPGTKRDLHDLPQTLLTVGSLDLFRDETVAFTDALHASGVDAALVVAEGGYHGFEVHDPYAPTSRRHLAAIDLFLQHSLGDAAPLTLGERRGPGKSRLSLGVAVGHQKLATE